MQSEKHGEELRITLQDLSSVQPVFHCEYLCLIDTDIHALTLTKQTKGLYAVVLATDFFGDDLMANLYAVPSAASPKTFHHSS